MKFSILFWNIWFHNQIHGKARSDRLMAELKRFVDQHEPDFIALNEVVQSWDGKSIPVLEYLHELGYRHSHCADLARFNDYWLSGAALCSRVKLSQTRDIVLSEHGFAAKKGFPGQYKKAISARVDFPGGRNVKIIVAHPLATVDVLHDHKVAMNKLNELVRSDDYSGNTVLVGDMNEWRLIPGAFRRKVADVMHSRTGSALHPTWRYNAHRFSPLRLNLDYVYWNKQSDLSMSSFEVLASDASDHRPLLAAFEYRARN